MKFRWIRFVFFAVLLFGGLWFAKTMQTSSQQVVNLTDNDAGKTLATKKGQVFTLTLPDHVDGGYRFDTIQYNTAVIALQKHSASTPPPNSAPGYPGIGTWKFIAIKKGTTNIKVTATRPWKGGGTVTVFENKVMVK
jgi:predicted secreted protein